MKKLQVFVVVAILLIMLQIYQFKSLYEGLNPVIKVMAKKLLHLLCLLAKEVIKAYARKFIENIFFGQ